VGASGGVPLLGPLLMGLKLVLLDWYRKSELTADRAALLAVQDRAAVERGILWLAGGSTRIGAELTVEGYRAQADELEAILERKRTGGVFDRLGHWLSGIVLDELASPSPWPAVRLREVAAFAASAQYGRLLAGEYEAVLGAAAAAATPGGEVGEGAPATASDAGGLLTLREDVAHYLGSAGRSASGALRGLFGRATAPAAPTPTAGPPPEPPLAGAPDPPGGS